MDGQPTPTHAVRVGLRGSPRVSLRVLITPILLALALQVPAAGAAQGVNRVQISYQAATWGRFVPLCVGETVQYHVAISRVTVVNGAKYYRLIEGGRISGAIDDPNVARFQPTPDVLGNVVEGGPPKPSATFTLVATAPGTTKVRFSIVQTGEDVRVGTGFPQKPDTVALTVTDCYDAYTSGLGTTFTETDMGDLRKPFFLVGHTPNVNGITTESQFMFFGPNWQNRTTGVYAFVDTGYASAAPGARCTAYVHGRYDVVLYGDPAKPVEGDLMLYGFGVVICPGTELPIAYNNAPGFEILFRPRLAPH